MLQTAAFHGITVASHYRHRHINMRLRLISYKSLKFNCDD